MGFRFRKSIRLAPGLRINLSKSGASLSVGGRGFTTNFSPRGTRQTFSIPGTGMSWSKSSSYSKGSRSGTRSGSSARSLAASTARAEREQLYEQAVAAVRIEDVRLRDVVEAWRTMPAVPDEATVARALRLQPFTVEEGPNPPDFGEAQLALRSDVEQEVGAHHPRLPTWLGVVIVFAALVLAPATYGIPLLASVVFLLGWWIKRRRTIARETKDELARRWPEMKERLKKEHAAELGRHAEAEKQRRQDWSRLEQERVAHARRLVAGDASAIEETVRAALEELDFPFDASCAASVCDATTVLVAIDLPEIEAVIPEKRLKALKNGALMEVGRRQTERKAAWRSLVLGIAVQVGRTVCAVAPSIQMVRVAAYTQRRQRSGGVADEWVYELSLEREALASLDPETFDSGSLLWQPTSRLSPAADGGLRKIPPPEWLDQIADEVA